MCIAILATAGAVVPPAHLAASFCSNPDGAGFAYVDKDTHKVIIKKGYFAVRQLIEAYERTLGEGHGETNAMLLHCRIATMGAVDRDNCHPFSFDGGALIHNGVLFSGTDPTGRNRSDTRIFTETLAKEFNYEKLRDNLDAVTSAIRYNKIAMLFDEGNYLILNEQSGYWVDDVWYSNRSYMPWTRSGMSRSGLYYGQGHPYGNNEIIDDWE